MEPIITQKSELTLMGMSFYGDPFSTRSGWDEENEIGRLWQRLMRFLNDNEARLPVAANQQAAYEVHVYSDETVTKGLFEVFVGVQVDQVRDIPVELLIKILPASEYAVFTFQGEEISSDWYLHIDQWIAAAGYQRSHPFSFQYLDERFKGVDNLADSILDVYMPIKPAE
jgi:AraC family transcriptional regulator